MKRKEIEERIIKAVGSEYLLIDERDEILSHEKMKIKHITCGNILEITPNKFLDYGRRCKFCSGKVKGTTESFKKKVYDLVGDEYEVIGEYINRETPIKMKHKSGEDINVKPYIFLAGYGRCSEDSSINEKKTDDFKKKVKKIVGDEYEVLGTYKHGRVPIEIKHNLCGNVYSVNPESFLSGSRCKKCAHTHKTSEQFKDEVGKLSNGEYEVISEYFNSKEKVLFKHGKHEFSMRPNDFLNGHRCPICSGRGSSKPEDELKEFIEGLGFKVEKGRYFEKKYQIDLLIPEINIGIEYDGVYWHSDSFKNKNYHLDKMNFFLERGIRIINIFEDEWLWKKEIVKSKLKNIFGKTTERIYARSCSIVIPKSSEKNKLLDEFHIQGHDMAKYIFGLEYNGEIVSVMTFCKLRKSLGNKKSKENVYELSRFASKKNVIGGFSKLLKHAENAIPNIEKIITYADLRWSSPENNVYKQNGFKESHWSEPNYWYCKDNKRFHRFGFRKQKLKELFPDLYDEKKTEFEIMNQTKYVRVYDCGNLVFEKTIKKD